MGELLSKASEITAGREHCDHVRKSLTSCKAFQWHNVWAGEGEKGRERERRLQGQQGLCCPHNWAKGSLDSQVSSLVPASLLSRNGKVDEDVSCPTFMNLHANSVKAARSQKKVIKFMTALWVCGKVELKTRFIILTQTPAQTSAETTRGNQWQRCYNISTTCSMLFLHFNIFLAPIF